MTSSASVGLRLGGMVAAGLIAAGVAGCASSGSSTAAGAATTPAAASGTGTGTGTGAASGTGSSAPSSPAGGTGSVSPSTGPGGSSGGSGASADACTTGSLAVKTVDSQGAAGSTYTSLDFTNTGSTTCSLYGYPGVSLAAGNPVAQVGAAAARSTMDRPSVVQLAPGKTGNALLRITQALNYPKATCSPADTTYLRVYPPGETASILLPYKSMGCAKTAVVLLTIGVVQPGTTSSQ